MLLGEDVSSFTEQELRDTSAKLLLTGDKDDKMRSIMLQQLARSDQQDNKIERLEMQVQAQAILLKEIGNN